MTENIFPYELPQNWHWTTLENVCELSKGEKISDEKFPYLDVKYLRGAKEKKLVEGGNFISKGTKAILVDGENSGEIFTVFEDGYLGSTLREVKIFENVDANFFQYFISTKKNLYRQNKKGSAIPHLNKNLFYSTFFPLPPIDEQKKIVERIESLFSKLDSAKSIVQKILDGYKLRRAAILHKAFTGELSKNFRAENNLSLDDWQEKTLGEVIKKIKYGSSAKSTYQKNNFPILRIPNIMENRIDFSDTKYLFKPDDSCQVCSNDILIVRSNGSRDLVGKCALIPEMEKNYFYASFLICISPTKSISAKFLSTYLNSNLARKQMFSKAKSSSGIYNINSKEIKSIKIFLPPLAEQKEIVRVLDSLLDKEQRTKEIAEKILQEIDLLKKSVLARAFRGEL